MAGRQPNLLIETWQRIRKECDLKVCCEPVAQITVLIRLPEEVDNLIANSSPEQY